MEILRLIEAKEKAKHVIKSCTHTKQLEAAERYVELFGEKFEDEIGKKELLIELQKRIKLIS